MLGKPTRPGFHTVTPYLIVPELELMIDFLKQAFAATEHFRAIGSAGGTHVEMRIGDSMIMISGGAQNSVAKPMPIMIFLYIEDADKVYQAAIAAGATSLMEPTDGAFGEPRGAGIKDISGNEWYFSNWVARPDAPPAYIEPAPAPAITEMPDVIPMLTYEDGAAAMSWLTTAFGFAEVTRWIGEDGKLSHGEMVTGSGRIMLASPTPAYESPKHHQEHCERARAWSTVPWVIDGVLVYVDDIDQHYTQAKAAGATLLSDMEDGGPGRRYRVEDIEGHRWMFMQRSPAING